MLSPRYWTFLIIVAAAVGFSMIRLSQTPEVIASPADPYEYRYMALENGLKVLLVKTPDADKASAALSVNVGSMDDPTDREGLAHFLEHMLFLGTEPYPEPDEYQQFIKQNGGTHNAFTAYAQTTYFFDIDNEQLPGALDRFAPFFISPTFDAAYVDREKNAVHAEYSASLKEDGRRIYSAQKLAMNPEFGFARFSTGNLDTLADRPDSKIRDELISFYRTHYSSDRMTLVIAGDYELDQLGNQARQLFSDVPKRDVHFQRDDVPVFADGHLPMDMNIAPIKELRELRFTFPLPEILSQYQHKPVSLIANLIGHEGEGSLLALLKEKGWAESLSAGRSLSTRHASTLVVSISLTRQGLLHTDDITQLLFDYISLVKSEGISEALKVEQERLNELTFRYQEHGRIMDYTTRLSSNMLVFPVEDIIYGDYRAEPPTNALLEQYLSHLTPENVLRTIIAPGVDTDTTDPWYGTEIRIRPSSFTLSEGHDARQALHLPEANPFVPENLALNPDPALDAPQLRLNTPGRQVWYYPEHEFQVPKAQVQTSLRIPAVQQDARQRLLAKLYTRTVNESLNTYSYPAYLAGLSYRLSPTANGIEVAVGGYYDKLPELLERIYADMTQFSISDDEFTRYSASLKRALENNLKAKPFQRTLADMKNWIIDPSFSDTDLLPLLDTLQREELEQFAKEFASELASVTYVHGAMSGTEADALADLTERYFPANIAQPESARIVKASVGQYQQAVEQDHPDKVMTLYVQGRDNSDRARAETGLLAQMISAPYYQYMRTEQQLGYIVFATAYPQRSVPALVFIVQSPTATPQEMMDHSQVFFRQYEADLSTMAEEEFVLFREGLMTKLLEKPKNMSEKAGKFWGDLIDGRYTFDSREAIAAEVANVTQARIRNLYQEVILDQQWPWLLFEKGGAVEGFDALNAVERDTLERFPTPMYPFSDNEK